MGKVLVIEHGSGGPLALFDEWFEQAGVEVDVARPYAGDVVPDIPDRNALVVLGGPMGAYDDADYPWLAGTKRLLSAYVSEGRPTMGICLGHQLLTVACGGEVIRNPDGKQMGLRDVGLGPEASDDPLFGALVPPVRSVHWNDDVVSRLPDGAVPLAAGAEGWPQAYRLGQTAWGVQFHPEVGAAQVSGWAKESEPGPGTAGRDFGAAVRAIEVAEGELRRTWQPFASRFAALVNGERSA
ncbi:MAG: type 1 glutamine amidotransferase [Streptosporangiales bacterium]